MQKITYPNITDISLVPVRAIEALIAKHPDLLERPECPYSPAVKSILARLGQKAAPAAQHEYSEDDLLREITSLYEELKTTTISSDAKDSIAMIKTRADLLSKLVGLKEKAFTARDLSLFQRTVVGILENVLTPAQRNEFLEELSKNV